MIYNRNPPIFTSEVFVVGGKTTALAKLGSEMRLTLVPSLPPWPTAQGARSFGAPPNANTDATSTAQPRRTDASACPGLAVGLDVAFPRQKYKLARAGVT